MGRFFLHCLCLAILLSSYLTNCTITDDEEPRRTFPVRRAIDGTRGRKYYDPEEGGVFDSYGSSGGRYDPYEEETDLSDIRQNVPGEPGVDYPSYTRLPKTDFVCEADFRGYYADESVGCQVFHVCDGNFLISSFLCPIGSIFSQKLLTCDWWTKVDCSSTRNYHAINSKIVSSEKSDDEILDKVFETASVRPETINQLQQRHQDRRDRVNFGISGNLVTERSNDLSIGQEKYSDYSDYPGRFASRYKPTSGQQSRQRYQDEDYYSQDVEPETQRRNENPSLKVQSFDEDRQNSFKNDFKPSLAPTVPTPTTLRRRFFTSTNPTTYRPSTANHNSGGFDLDFESSDHLYTARGREEAVKAATPPSFIRKDDAKLENLDLPRSVNIVDENKGKIDNMQESESSDHKINLSMDDLQSNWTKIDTLNETIIMLDEKEKAIEGDLDRLRDQITETLSILTIDNENRDPAVFSYNRNEEMKKTKEEDAKTFAEPPIVDSTISNLESESERKKKPADFLQPPQDIVSEFRIMVLDETSYGNNENSTNSEKSVTKNSTLKPQTAKVPANHITPPLLNDEREGRESRVIRIFINNSTTTETISTGNSTDSKIPDSSTERVKSVETTPIAILERGNSTDDKIVSEKIAVTPEIVKSVELNPLNLTTLIELISSTTPIPIRNITAEDLNLNSKNEISDLDDSIEPLHEDSLGKESNVTKLDEALAKDLSPSSDESVIFKRSNNSEEILSTVGNIGDSIQLGSSPFEVTFTVNKDEEFDPNGDIIKKLIAQQETGDSIGASDFSNFEIVKSSEPEAPGTNFEDNFSVDNSRNGRRLSDDSENSQNNFQKFDPTDFQSANYLRSIVALENGPNAPRPFAVNPARNVEIITPSDLGDELLSTSSRLVSQTEKGVFVSETTRSPAQMPQSVILPEEKKSDKALETLETSPSGFPRNIQNEEVILEQLSQTFGEKLQDTREKKLIFDLPDSSRTINFQTGLPHRVPEEINFRVNEQPFVQKTNKTELGVEKMNEKTVVETEFVPSLGFSLNTEQEREVYMDAVFKGLLADVRPTETTINDTKISDES